MIKQLLTLIIFLSVLLNCEHKKHKMDINDIELYQNEIKYPYVASEKRAKVILENMNKLQKGMNKNQVINVLTAPDEINFTYKSIKSNNDIDGFSFVYLLRKNKEIGSVNEKNEKLVRIHFDNTEKLIWSYSQNIDEFKAIEK